MAESPRIEELQRRVQMDPASIAFAALAEEYRRAGRHEEAIATCVAGLKRHPAYVSARVTLGRSLLETGQFEEARIELEQVLRVAPENLSAIRGLAEIHDRAREAPDARRPDTSPVSPEPSSEAPSAPAARRVVPVSTSDDRSPGTQDRQEPAPSAPKGPPLLHGEPSPAQEIATALETASSSVVPRERGTPAICLSPRLPPEHPRPALHPDVMALPALEALLDAIIRARGGPAAVLSPRVGDQAASLSA